MGKRKITCNNASCKHHISGGGCDTCIMLDSSGKCKSFEKGFVYYFTLYGMHWETKTLLT